MKNIILLMSDQQRIDYCGYTNDSVVDAPNIKRIASGTSFTNCQTPNPICTPARTSLITGKYPHQIGTLDMSGDLSLQHPTFMQALREVGYHTCGIGKFHFLQTWSWNTPRGTGVDLVDMKQEMKKYGYDYIWETSGKQLSSKNYCDYMEHLDQKGLLDAYRDFVDTAGPNGSTPEQVTDESSPWPFDEADYVDVLTCNQIIDQIKNRPADKPFYIFGSFCSPHKPYDAPKRYLELVPYEEIDDFILQDGVTISEEAKKKLYKQRQSSKAMIKLIDDQIGRIFNTLEDEQLLNDTVIIYTSDHGDMLGDHYRIQKSVPWKQASTVPLAIYHPDYLYANLNASPVSLMDVTATILDVAGLDPVKSLSKDWPSFNNIVPTKSLLPIVSGATDQIRVYTFTECKGQWQMLQSDNYKYIRYLNYEAPGQYIEELYDLKADPDEQFNIVIQGELQPTLTWFRDCREYIMDTTPPAQTSWAHLSNTKSKNTL